MYMQYLKEFNGTSKGTKETRKESSGMKGTRNKEGLEGQGKKGDQRKP